jgi:hypothetical protein
MNSFSQSNAASANHSGPGNSMLGNFKSRTATLAIGTIGAVMMSLVLASAATTSADHRTGGASGGATVQKSIGRCKVPTASAAFAT